MAYLAHTEYGTLSPDVIKVLEIDNRVFRNLEILLRVESPADDYTPIYATIDDSLARCPDPVVEGNDCEYISLSYGFQGTLPLTSNVVVKMISAGAPKYAIRMW